MKKIYTHETSFEDENQMIDFLKGLKKTDVCYDCYIEEGRIHSIKDDCALFDPTTVAGFYGMPLDSVVENAINECVEGLACVWTGPVEGIQKTIPISTLALDSLADRAGLRGRAIIKKPTILNEGFELWDRTDDNIMRVLIRNGSMLAAHSDKYSWLSQADLVETNKVMFTAEFGDYKFEQGVYSDEVTYALYMLPNQAKSLLEIYNKKAKKLGEKVATDLVPAIVFSTSDTTRSAASLWAAMVSPSGRAVRLGDSKKLVHSGAHTIADYVANCDNMLDMLKNSVKRLEKLLSIELLYPENCFQNMVKAFSLMGAAANEAYEDFCIKRGGKVTAHSLFWSIWNISAIEEAKGASVSRLMDIEEKLARIIFADWKRFDTPMTN